MVHLAFFLILLFGCGSSEKSDGIPAIEADQTQAEKFPISLPTPIPTVTATPIPPGPNPPPPGPIPPALTVWQTYHNDYRCTHGVQPLMWSKQLADEAQAWANRCVFQHEPNIRHGENLAMGTDLTPEEAMVLWYDEGKEYPYGIDTPPFSVMHFTQMVWARTSELGCASAQCPQGIFHVCRYNPAGNVIGQFSLNVYRPSNLCQGGYPLPTLAWLAGL